MLLRLIALPFRVLAFVLGALAVAAAGYDLWRLATGGDVPTPLGALWFALSPETLNLAQAAIQRGIHPALWDPGVQFLLALPGWLSLFLLAVLFLLLAQLIYRGR